MSNLYGILKNFRLKNKLARKVDSYVELSLGIKDWSLFKSLSQRLELGHDMGLNVYKGLNREHLIKFTKPFGQKR